MLDATPIAVDTRGEQETIADLLFLIEPSLVSTGSQLYAGDLYWATEGESYGVELKSTPDLLNSLWSKETGERLEWQLNRLREAVDVPILGHHGVFLGADTIEITKELRRSKGGWFAPLVTKTGYRKESVDAFLWSIRFPSDGEGIHVVERATREDLLRAIVAIYWWSRKDDHSTFRGADRRKSLVKGGANSSYGLSLRILAAFPSIGENRGKALLERFQTLSAILTASDEELQGVSGIGKGVVKKLREVLYGGYTGELEVFVGAQEDAKDSRSDIGDGPKPCTRL